MARTKKDSDILELEDEALDDFVDAELAQQDEQEILDYQFKKEQKAKFIDRAAYTFCLLVLLGASVYGIRTLLNDLPSITAYIMAAVALVPVMYAILRNSRI